MDPTRPARLRQWPGVRSFPAGTPILVMCALSLLSGAALVFIGAGNGSDSKALTFWLFDATHANMIRGTAETRAAGITPLSEQFRRQTGREVDVQLVGGPPLDLRLVSLTQSGATGHYVPDLVEIEIGSVGKYFRGPRSSIGLLPLRDRLEEAGLLDHLLPSRITPWSKDGEIYGVPMDVHPVALAYRHDLFEAAGIDVEALQTWEGFHEAGLEFRRYWSRHGHPEYRALEMPRTSTSILEVMLLQRGINLVDEEGQVHLDHALTLDTLCRYVRMAAGQESIGSQPATGASQWVREIAGGYNSSLIAPDWRLALIEQAAPDMSGRLRLRPLPIFEPGDVPTATWGGTAFAIPRGSDDPEAAWELLKFIMFTREADAERYRHTRILPATPASWDHPSIDVPHDYWSGQRVGRFYVSLARLVPRRTITPWSAIASAELTLVLMRAIDWLEAGGDPESLPATLRPWLAAAQADVEMRIRFGRFDEPEDDADGQ